MVPKKAVSVTLYNIMSKKDKLSVEAYKGVRDFFPEDQAFLNYLFAAMRRVAERYGYAEYHASILEPAELYRSKGAVNEEMVNEQTYTFTDRGGREVTLRPEMTPTVSRMVAAKRREMGFPLRLFSIPNVFRYENTQRGRLREHWQLNVDLFGSTSLASDAEIIAVAHDIMNELGAEDTDFQIKIGSRMFLNTLTEKYDLSPEHAAAMRLILDRRAKMPAAEFAQAMEQIGVPVEAFSAEHVPADVQAVIALLTEMGVTNAVFAPDIVRGFDYYTGIVFEIFDTHKDNNRSIAGGGRYDNLVSLFSDDEVPTVGFGMGDVTLKDFLDVRGLLPKHVPMTDLYIALAQEEVLTEALMLAQELRSEGVNVAVDFGDKKLGDQIKAAAKHSIPHLLIVGTDELARGSFTVKELETGVEHVVSRAELASFFTSISTD